MPNLIRTSITIPKHIYTQARIRASEEGKNFSKFVAATLSETLELPSHTQNTPNETTILGKYSLGQNEPYTTRADIYEDHIQKPTRD